MPGARPPAAYLLERLPDREEAALLLVPDFVAGPSAGSDQAAGGWGAAARESC